MWYNNFWVGVSLPGDGSPERSEQLIKSFRQEELIMKILYAASEAQPFAASGGLADVAGSLPKALVEAGHECMVVMPYYINTI